MTTLLHNTTISGYEIYEIINEGNCCIGIRIVNPNTQDWTQRKFDAGSMLRDSALSNAVGICKENPNNWDEIKKGM